MPRRRGRRRTDTQTEAGPGQTGGAGYSRRRLSKGKPAIWGPGSPPLPSPQPPPSRAPGRPVCPPRPVLAASCAAAPPGRGQTTLTSLGDGVPQSVASPRLRGRGGSARRRRRHGGLLTLPGNRRSAARQRRPTVRGLKGAGALDWRLWETRY